MRPHGVRPLCFLTLALAVGCVPVPVVSTPEVGYRREIQSGGFVRYGAGDQVAGDMEIAARTYRGPGNAEVRLVAMVHFGDASFYEQVRKELDEADAVLFEGVKSDEDEESALDSMQPMLEMVEESTGLVYQADALPVGDDPGFVWADLASAELEKAAEALGVPLLPDVSAAAIAVAVGAIRALMVLSGLDDEEKKLVFRHLLADLLAGGSPDADRIREALKAYRAPVGLDPKALDALELKLAGEGLADGEIEDMRTTIAQDYCILVLRNDRVMEVLDEVLDEGEAKRVVILYGAEHMWDLAERLEARGWRQVRQRWRTAWRVQSLR